MQDYLLAKDQHAVCFWAIAKRLGSEDFDQPAFRAVQEAAKSPNFSLRFGCFCGKNSFEGARASVNMPTEPVTGTDGG